MKIGASIALIVLGAILSFAVADAFSGVDLTTIGYILMGAGVLGLILGLMLANKKNVSTSTVHEQVAGSAPAGYAAAPGGYAAGPAAGTQERVVTSETASDGGPRLI